MDMVIISKSQKCVKQNYAENDNYFNIFDTIFGRTVLLDN